MKHFKTDIFNDAYQNSDNKAKNDRKYLNNYVNGTLGSSFSFMTPVSRNEDIITIIILIF